MRSPRASSVFVPTNVPAMSPRGSTDAPSSSIVTLAVLSDARVRTLKPKEKSYKQADFDGLYLLVKPNGSKLWRFKYRWLLKEKLLALGKYADVTLADARRKRDEARSLVSNGADPSHVRRQEKAKEAAAQNETFTMLAAELL
jgi:Arm DNA-binding domain